MPRRPRAMTGLGCALAGRAPWTTAPPAAGPYRRDLLRLLLLRSPVELDSQVVDVPSEQARTLRVRGRQ